MNTSAIVPHAFDCGDIEAAHQLVEEMSLQPRPYLGASVAVGARAGLGRERRKCERPTSDSRFIDDVKLASAGDRLSHGGLNVLLHVGEALSLGLVQSRSRAPQEQQGGFRVAEDF